MESGVVVYESGMGAVGSVGSRATPLLAVRGLSVTYAGGLPALRDVHLDVPAGAVVAVVGPSGAGKTTLLRAISGLLDCHRGRVVSGTVELDGRRIERLDPAAIVRLGVSQVMEGRRVFADLTVEENLRAGALSRPRSEVAGSLARVHELFPVLAERASSAAGYLSGGQQQMLSLGRALMASPRLLLLDEPWVGLAPDLVDQLRASVTAIAAAGVTVVLVDTHLDARLDRAADRRYVLEGGTVVAEDRPPTPGVAPVAARTGSAPGARAPSPGSAPVLALEDVSLRFGSLVDLDGLSFAVGAAEAVAVVGPNGAGKTSILNCINQVYRPERGSIRVGGTEVVGWRPHRVAALGVARTFQTPAAFGHLDVLDNLLLGRHHRMRTTLVGAALRWPRAGAEERAHRARCTELATQLGLGPYIRRPVGSLAFGVQKRVEFGRAMAADPVLLLLDEPSAGMSPGEIDDMIGAIVG
ncbi:MAG: ATP-binding cassette domain-containing protein, partial [Acidimicrobiales bacterium]